MYTHILKLLNARKSEVLLFAAGALPESQFNAFRKKFLDEFGQRGFERELEMVMAGLQPTGTDRQGRA